MCSGGYVAFHGPLESFGRYHEFAAISQPLFFVKSPTVALMSRLAIGPDPSTNACSSRM